MILTPQYGYRSACCYAPIRLGRRKVRNTNVKVEIWICCKCSKRDVPLVQYNKSQPPQATESKPKFASIDEDNV